MLVKFKCLLVWATVWLSVPALAIEEVEVDVELQLLLDVSGSVDSNEYQLQLNGYVNAFANSAIQNAVTAGPRGSIAVQMIMWSGYYQQQVMIDWMHIDSPSASLSFSQLVAAISRPFSGMTSIGNAISFGAGEFSDNGFSSDRQVMDVSGDGTNNWGPGPGGARDDALAQGINTINGIAITQDQNVISQYEQDVAGGDNAFVLVANDFEDFENAISQKLVAEITNTKPVSISEPPVLPLILFGLLFIWALSDKKR